MSTDSAEVRRSLPDHPKLRHLKDQANALNVERVESLGPPTRG